MDGNLLGWIVGIGLPALYGLGLISAGDALMKTRTPQGAIAWVLALITIPPLALPAYWVFGRTRFDDYVQALRTFDRALEKHLEERKIPDDLLVNPDAEEDPRMAVELRGFQELASIPLLCGNHARLLIDGKATFDAILDAIDAAQSYVLAQYYIIHDDRIGTAFQEKLIAAAQRGVRVYLLYDEVGSHALPRAYLDALRDAGAEVAGFSGTRGWLGRFRLNFRNHRKIVVVDGKKAFTGGLNVGDEYLGRDPALSPWRDTHLELEGPAVLGLQFAFVRDWYYGQQAPPEGLQWNYSAHPANQRALIHASGPADRLETCGLLFTHAIDSAENRVWIATPYFVPNGQVLGALQLAALRGVDVRVIMPRKSDSILFKYVPYAYLPEAECAGVKIYLYDEGFMHQKVMLVDDDYAAVGTANLDNRSFRLNFEVTCLINDAGFCKEVADMLEDDFSRSSRLTDLEPANKSLPFRLATQTTRLLAPVL